MSRKYDARLRREHLKWIISFLEDNELKYEFIAGDWHIRIEQVLDIYPTHQRYFFLVTKERGSFKDYEDLGRLILEMSADQKRVNAIN